MMGRGAPFDNKRNTVKKNDDDDFAILSSSSSNDGNYDGYDEAEIFTAAAADTNDHQDNAPTKNRRQRPNNSNNINIMNNSNAAAAAAKDAHRQKFRPKRNPKGHRFRGWRHSQEFNFWANAAASADNHNNSNDGNHYSESDDNSDGGGDNNNNNRAAAWWRNNSRCFEIDYICHHPYSNKWAYMTSMTTETSPNTKEVVFQPTMELKPSAWKYDGSRYNAQMRIGIKVDSPTRRKQQGMMQMQMEEEEGNNNKQGNDDDDDFSFDQCQLSKTPTHMVLQSLFNDMVGEFYSRSLLGLYQTMMMGVEKDDYHDSSSGSVGEDKNGNEEDNNNNESSTSSSTPLLPWEEDIQFYIHIPLKGKQVLDGHKLLTAGMLANPNAGMPKSFLDLFQQPSNDDTEDEEEGSKEEGDGGAADNATNNNNEDECQCYRKMVFCGYDTFTHDEQVLSEDIDIVEEYHEKKQHRGNDDDDDEEDMESNTDGDDEAGGDDEEEKDQTNSTVSETPPSFNPNLKYTLWSSGTVDTYKNGRDPPLTPDCIKGKNCQGYANLRNLMSSNFVKHYPTLSDDIVTFRRMALLENSVINDDYSGDTNEWLVVGLTQRTYRRAWLNLLTVMKRCNTIFNDRRVVCIAVNVEDTSSPYEQLILHRSLDVMIGVHGAQLTQAVVLLPHAHVLEILPWVPSYIRGNWVTRRDAPTPLGIIYHNTDLNHAGYSLDRTSTDLCVGVGEVGSEEEKDCFLGQRKIFIWDNRDFNVEPEVIIQYIEKLVLFMRDDEMGKLCSEVKDRLDERFVLYNVWCVEEEEEDESTLSVNHFYAETGPKGEKQEYGTGKGRRRKEKLKASTM